jgi:hypothetical protein
LVYREPQAVLVPQVVLAVTELMEQLVLLVFKVQQVHREI